MRYLGLILPAWLLLVSNHASAEPLHPPEQNQPATSPPIAAKVVTPMSYGRPHSCDEDQYYPITALQDGAEGKTRVELTVAASGEVSAAGINVSSGRADLDDASIACAKTWRYRPALSDGRPVEARVRADIVWRIRVDPEFQAITDAAQACVLSTDVGATEFRQAPLHAVVRLHFSRGKITNVALVASSGIPDLDQRHLACFKSLPPELTKPGADESDVLFSLNWVRP